LRGEVARYTWVGLGSSHLLSDIVAAMLLAQLDEGDRIQQRRRAIWQRYERELAGWASAQRVRLPVVPADRDQTHHIFYLVTPSPRYRERLIDHLALRGIPAVFHYLPLHLSPMGQRLGGRPGDCPVTEDVSERLLRLPLFFDLSDTEQTEVIEEVRSFSA
jgi:dTDP-4-amino-4,6-dideoxygalactose transaminase